MRTYLCETLPPGVEVDPDDPCKRWLSRWGLSLGDLTREIEWFTQLHYVEHVRERTELDELFRDILRFHWIDESRHAHQRRSYRWTFLVSGLEHPNFVGIVEQLTANGADKLSQAAGVLSA
jgi:hypothetical protein